ncbi:MAG: DUF192 domain-containing protein [Actinobacteria bacterium]|nr:DUF192 domain-containing protein [Actinomycetota bacterium]
MSLPRARFLGVRQVMLGEVSVEVPTTMRERARGLRGRDGLAPGHGMLFPRARSVHTFGMRFPIAVAFLDRDLVVRQVRRLPPRRLAWSLCARHVLELAADADVRPGTRLGPVERPVGSARERAGQQEDGQCERAGA